MYSRHKNDRYGRFGILAGGMTEAEILGDFPDLTAEDIRACLAFAADRERRLAFLPDYAA